tara:strand:+ start:1293 stop:2021 length:729 start_codon:yes stop_codon:yes gene_type:complete
MAYFRELPNIAYQSPLSHKNSSGDYIVVKNLFRRIKLSEYVKSSATAFNKFVIGEGDRPDTIAEVLYGDSRLDYVVILVAGITNITHQWPLQDYQVYNYALNKYGSETEMNANHHYETFEIRDEQGHQILPPNLIVDANFKIDGTIHKFPSTTTYTLRSQEGYTQLDDKNEFTVATDNIAHAVTNLEYEYSENEKKREINVLKSGYLNVFINDLKDIIKYDKSSSYVNSKLAITENTELVNP